MLFTILMTSRTFWNNSIFYWPKSLRDIKRSGVFWVTTLQSIKPKKKEFVYLQTCKWENAYHPSVLQCTTNTFQGARKRPEFKNDLLPVSSLAWVIGAMQMKFCFLSRLSHLKKYKTLDSVFLILNNSIGHWSLEASGCFCENEI